MNRKPNAIGTSARPEVISASRLRALSFAVSIRCTMSWSVPCVAMVVNVEPSSAAQIVYSLPRMPRTLPQNPWGGIDAARKDRQVARLLEHGSRARPAAHAVPERDQRIDHRAAHHRRLDHVGPDDCADAARSSVDRGQRRDENDRARVNPNGLRIGRSRRRGPSRSRARPQPPRRKGRVPLASSRVSRNTAEAALRVVLPKRSCRVLVNRDDVVVVEGADEKARDDDAREGLRRRRAARR